VSSANLPPPAGSGSYGESALARVRRKLASMLFREDDEFARDQGWQIQTSRFGLSRTYRHPGFEMFASSPDRSSLGPCEDADCSCCVGIGQAMLGQPSGNGRGRDI
jgi:hypothetical protein